MCLVKHPTFKIMKKLILTILFCLITSITFSDEFKIPFSCYPKQVQSKFKEHKLKLDLSGNNRTEDSWGFIQNKGTMFTIFTYSNITAEEMDLMLTILMGE